MQRLLQWLIWALAIQLGLIAGFVIAGLLFDGFGATALQAPWNALCLVARSTSP